MTNYARWSQNPLFWPGQGTFSDDSQIITTSSGGGGLGSISASTGKFIFGISLTGGGNCQIGIFTPGYYLNSTPYSGVALNQANEVFYFQGGSGSNQFTISGSFAGAGYFCIDVGAQTLWISIDGVNWYGAGGTVYTASQVAAGTGGINWGAFPYVSGGMAIFCDANTALQNFTLINTVAGLGFTPPSGFSIVPPTLTFAADLFNISNSLSLSWAGNSLSGLGCSLDGGTVTAMGGGTTGSSGVATGPTISDYNIHAAAIQDTTFKTDYTGESYFQACPSGPPLLSMVDNSVGGSTTETWTLASSANTLSFAINSNVLAHDGSFGEGDTFAFTNSAGGTLLSVSIIYPPSGGGVDGTLTVGSFTPVVLTSGADGQVTGNMTLGVSGGNVVGTLGFTANGTLQSSSSYTFATGTTSDLVSQVLVTPVATLNGRTRRGVSISGSAPAGTAQLPWRSILQTSVSNFHQERLFEGRQRRRTGLFPAPSPSASAKPFDGLQRVLHRIAAHFAEPVFAGRQKPRYAKGVPPPPPVLQLPYPTTHRLMRVIAAHFPEPVFKGQRQPRPYAMNYGGGVNLPARASQVVLESLLQDKAGARASQTVLETLLQDRAAVRASQVVIETLYKQSNPTYVRASQVVLEVLVPIWDTPMPPVYPQLPGLLPKIVKRPKYSTGVGVGSSGREVRVGYWAKPQWEWDLGYDVLGDNAAVWMYHNSTGSDLRTLVGFVLEQSGALSPFYFQDPDDYAVTGQFLGTGDGSTTQFYFQRTFGNDGFTGTEIVGGVNTGEDLSIYINGTVQTTGFTINTATPVGNYVQFTSPPAAGATITADFQFWYFCRFKDDSYDFTKMMKFLWGQEKITIFSLKN